MDVHLDNADAARALVDSTLDNLERLREVAAKAEADAANWHVFAKKPNGVKRPSALRRRRRKPNASPRNALSGKPPKPRPVRKRRRSVPVKRPSAYPRLRMSGSNGRLARLSRKPKPKRAASRKPQSVQNASAQEAEDRTKREEAARQADREHRGKVMGEAKSALIEIGAAEDLAKKIVLAIVAGEIPHVSLRF
jgi:colicin import membrane protein